MSEAQDQGDVFCGADCFCRNYLQEEASKNSPALTYSKTKSLLHFQQGTISGKGPLPEKKKKKELLRNFKLGCNEQVNTSQNTEDKKYLDTTGKCLSFNM